MPIIFDHCQQLSEFFFFNIAASFRGKRGLVGRKKQSCRRGSHVTKPKSHGSGTGNHKNETECHENGRGKGKNVSKLNSKLEGLF